MRVRDLCLGLGVPASLLTGACEDRSAESAPTAPDVATAPSIARGGRGHVSHFTSKGWFGDFWFNADVSGEGYESAYLGVYQGGHARIGRSSFTMRSRSATTSATHAGAWRAGTARLPLATSRRTARR